MTSTTSSLAQKIIQVVILQNKTTLDALLPLSQKTYFSKLHNCHYAPQFLLCNDLASSSDSEICVSEPKSFLHANPTAHQLSKLKWVQSTFAGVNEFAQFFALHKDTTQHIALTRLGGMQIQITCIITIGVFGDAMAEYCMGQIIAHERQFYTLKEKQAQQIWARSNYEYRLLSTLTLGLIGFGEIAQRIAAVAQQAFKMNVIACKQSVISSTTMPMVPIFTSLQEMLPQCDYVISVLPSTPQTRYLLHDKLQHCDTKRGTVLINIGRGDLVSESVLLEALEKQFLRSAVLDVTEQEPLPATSKLWQHPQVTLTPHVSGITLKNDIVDLFERNMQRMMNGEQLLYPVDVSKGY